MLMPATHFSLGAATAGLLPDRHTLTYPKEAAYTRIVLQRLTPGGVKIRLPTLDELPQLLELETFWRSEVLASDESVLRKRLAAHPTGQFVVVAPDGMLLAAMYTQRVPSSKALLTTTRVTELDLHTPHGPVIQLLGVVQRTGALAGSDGRSAGQLLRDYVLHLGRLDATVDQACGVTRCRDYDPALGGDYQAHVSHGGDAGLRFHSDAGAAIGELVPDYRPRDAQNLGYGVMVCYELTSDGKRAAVTSTVARAAHGAASGAEATPLDTVSAQKPAETLAECESLVCNALDRLTYGDGRVWDVEAKSTAFMNLGVDSLDATTFVKELNAVLRPFMELPGTVMFEYADVKALARHIFERLSPPPPPQPPPQPSAVAEQDLLEKYRYGMRPWRFCEELETDRLLMAQAQAKGKVTQEMIDEAYALCCL